ncbi:MAG: BatA domain-containing protein, partial [Pseudomonadota bacterium]
MSIGALTFLSPWLLAGLAALPIIYWLLRTVPPRPRQIAFPATRILAELDNVERTPDKTPWWLMLIRLLAAALVILALAQPILNPDRSLQISGGGPVAIVVDNGWTSASGWAERQSAIGRVIDTAEQQSRGVVLVTTAGTQTADTPQIMAPADARRQAAALAPQPFPPDRAKARERLVAALGDDASAASLVWFSDGIDHGAASAFASALGDVGFGNIAVYEPPDSDLATGVSAGLGGSGELQARVVSVAGPRRDGILHALSDRGERLSEARFSIAAGSTSETVTFDLPLELRNQVARVTLSGGRSAGTVHLLDSRSKWNRVGLVSGANQEQTQPLLG